MSVAFRLISLWPLFSFSFFQRPLAMPISISASLPPVQGANQKNREPPWWVGGSEAKKGPESGVFSIFGVVLSISPHRETPKNVIKQNQEKKTLGFWSNFS
jgi:hypothetical protein